jgi:hypothetical protein
MPFERDRSKAPADRRSFIGGSDARIVMGQDEVIDGVQLPSPLARTDEVIE